MSSLQTTIEFLKHIDTTKRSITNITQTKDTATILTKQGEWFACTNEKQLENAPKTCQKIFIGIQNQNAKTIEHITLSCTDNPKVRIIVFDASGRKIAHITPSSIQNATPQEQKRLISTIMEHASQ